MEDPNFIDGAAIRALAAILHETDLSEIEVVRGTTKLRIARQMAAPPVLMGAAMQTAPAAVATHGC